MLTHPLALKRPETPQQHAQRCREHQQALRAATLTRCHADGQAPGRRMPPA